MTQQPCKKKSPSKQPQQWRGQPQQWRTSEPPFKIHFGKHHVFLSELSGNIDANITRGLIKHVVTRIM